MANILDNPAILKKLVQQKPFGLITDLDGTISPVPTNFQERKISPTIVHHLANLVSRFDLVAIVSGRETEALKGMVNIDGIKYIGHYGMEWWDDNRAILHPDVKIYLPSIRAIAKELETLRSVDGIMIQDKWASISIHYHLCPDPAAAKRTIMEVLRKSPHFKNLRIMDEKTNIGIIPPLDIDKGTAVKTLIDQFHLKGAVYVGDDVADVPAFRAVHLARENPDFNGVAIMVTGKGTRKKIIDEADFTLNEVQETGTLLEWLVNNTSS